jgi:hypothetical protein
MATTEDFDDPLHASAIDSSDNNSESLPSILSIGGAVAQAAAASQHIKQNREFWLTCICIVKFDTDYGPSTIALASSLTY